jgi:4-amino-4-deoxy-L-arabinose transferase-like glycosyltransferase
MTTVAGKGPPARWLVAAAFIAWLAFVLAAYYWAQNAFLQRTAAPLTEPGFWLAWRPAAASFGRSLLDFLAALWLVAGAFGAGLAILEWLRLGGRPAAEVALFAFGLGMAAQGLLGLALGLAGVLRWAGMLFHLASALGVVSLFGRSRRATLGRIWRALRQAPRPPVLVFLFLAISLGLALALALLPPTDWDGLFYHLTGPKIYLEQGSIRPGIDIPHLNYPGLMEMSYLAGLAIRGDVAAKLLHFAFLPPLAGLVTLLARRHFGVGNRWAAALFLLATPMVAGLASWAYNDLALAFYEVAALAAFLEWSGRERPAGQEGGAPRGGESGLLVASGLFAGLAMSLKYTSFVAPLALGLLLLWRQRGDWRQAARQLLCFGGAAAVVALPWYLKSLAFTGNPVYPFVFGGRFWDSYRAAAYAESGTGIGPDAAALVRLPLDMMLGLKDASRDGPTGPFFLAFLPFIVAYGLGRRDAPAAFRATLFFALVQYLFWTAGVVSSQALFQSRLLLPALVALCPALAWLYEELARFDYPQFSLRRVTGMVLALVMAAGLASQFLYWLPYQPWAYLAGGESRPAYLERMLGDHYRAMAAINEGLPAGAVVAFLWEPRSYYCERECRPDSILDRFGHLEERHGDAAGIAAALREEGVTHVLLWRDGLAHQLAEEGGEAGSRSEPATLRALRLRYLELVDSIGGYELYRLAAGGE